MKPPLTLTALPVDNKALVRAILGVQKCLVTQNHTFLPFAELFKILPVEIYSLRENSEMYSLTAPLPSS